MNQGQRIMTSYLVGDDVPQQQMGELESPLDVSYQYRPNFGAVRVTLNEGESVVADAGALLYMDGTVTMNTSCHNGCCAGYWRRCAGESGCQNTFTGPGRVAFADTTMPGDVLPFAVTRSQGYIFSTGSYLCSSPNVKVSGKWNGCCNCLCSGEGAFLTHITLDEESQTDVGVAICADYGAFVMHTIPPGKELLVDNGLFLACSDNVQMSVAILGGCYTYVYLLLLALLLLDVAFPRLTLRPPALSHSCCFGGEGFVLRFKATLSPVTVYTQNRDPAILKKMLKPPPAKSAENEAANAAA